MKKITVILFASIFAVSILAGCSGGSKTTSTNTTNSQSTESKSDLLSKTFADMMKSGKYLIHYRSKITVQGQTMDVEATMATDGKSTSITSVTSNTKTHMIMNDKTIYIFNDTDKTYVKIAIPESGTTEQSIGQEKIDTDGLTYLSKGRAVLNGKEMNYEEYKIDEGTLRYYFDGNKLYAIVVKSSDSEMIMEILEISDKVTSDMFEIPSGYSEASAQ